jgi:hypothetical protein
VYTKGLETDMRLWGMTSPLVVQSLEGKMAASILATLNANDQNPDRVSHRLYTHSVDPARHTGERTRS